MADIAMSRQSRRVFFRNGTVLKLAVLALLVLLIVLPLIRTVLFTLQPDTFKAWSDVLTGRLSTNLFYKPLGNTLLIGAVVSTGCVLIGGFLAWLVVMTNVPYRRTIGVMATLPFMIPSFAAALAWGTLFRNDRVGGQVGWLQGMGLDIPNWLAWGMVPTLLVLTLHYFSLAFTIIAAALATVNSDLVEAAQIAGAKGRRILLGIVLPVTTPALVAAGSLCFAGRGVELCNPCAFGAAGADADAIDPPIRDDRSGPGRARICDRHLVGTYFGCFPVGGQSHRVGTAVLRDHHRKGRTCQTVRSARRALAAVFGGAADLIGIDGCAGDCADRLQPRAIFGQPVF